MVTCVCRRQKIRDGLRIAQCFVKVNHSIKATTGSNPLVNFSAGCFMRFGIIPCFAEWQYCSSIYFYVSCMCLVNDFSISLNKSVGNTNCRNAVACTTNVVDSFKHDQPTNSSLLQHITFYAVHRSRSETVTEYTVAAKPHVQHTNIFGCLVLQETFGENIGPPVLLVR